MISLLRVAKNVCSLFAVDCKFLFPLPGPSALCLPPTIAHHYHLLLYLVIECMHMICYIDAGRYRHDGYYEGYQRAEKRKKV